MTHPVVVSPVEYYKRLMRIAPASSLVAYWPLWDQVGRPYAQELAARAQRPGTPANVTFGVTGVGDGRTAARFNGTSSKINAYSGSLHDLMNFGEVTIIALGKVSGSGVWTDGELRKVVFFGADSSDNYIFIGKGSSDNSLVWRYEAGATIKQIAVETFTDTDWMSLAITVGVAADELIAYKDGAQIGSTQTGLGTFAGSLASTVALVGALNTTPVQVWDGDIAHVAIWRKVLTPAQIAAIDASADPAATIQATERDDLVAYWPLDDDAGASAARDLSPARGMDGVVSGATLGQPGVGDGRTCSLLDGSNDLLNVFGLRLQAAFPKTKGALGLWVWPSGAGVWTDAANRRLASFQIDANNLVEIRRGGDNEIVYEHKGGGTSKTVTAGSQSFVRPALLGIDWDTSGNVRAILNGEQTGSTQTSGGTLTGNLASAVLGAQNTTPDNVWDGYVAHAFLRSDVLSLVQWREAYLAGVRA